MLNLSLQVNPIQLYVKKDEIKKSIPIFFYEMEFVLPVFKLPLCYGSKKGYVPVCDILSWNSNMQINHFHDRK